VAPRPDATEVAASVRALGLSLERWRSVFAHRYGLADHDSMILSHLSTAGGRLLPRELSAIMQLRTGTLTAMLDRLESADFVRRVPNPDDRRSTFVELTERGGGALAESSLVLERSIREGIPARTHAQFARYLAELATTVEGAVDELETQLKPRRARRARPRSN